VSGAFGISSVSREILNNNEVKSVPLFSNQFTIAVFAKFAHCIGYGGAMGVGYPVPEELNFFALFVIPSP